MTTLPIATQVEPSPIAGTLEVRLMGVVDFDSAMHLQQRLVYEVAGCNDQSGGILVCEHPPIVTIGREGSSAHVGASATELRSQQLQIRWTEETNFAGEAIIQTFLYLAKPMTRWTSNMVF